MTTAIARSERLVARRPTLEDEPDYRRLLLAPGVQAWLRPAPLSPRTATEVAEVLDRDRAHWEEHGFGPWVLLDGATGDFLGRGGLAWKELAGERAVELPWALLPSCWGRGLATEAAQAAVGWARALGLAEVISLTLTSNTASRRVMEKAGLHQAGHIEHAGLPHVLFRLRL